MTDANDVPRANPGAKVPGLDLLRSAAILSVFVFHYSMSAPGLRPWGRYGWAGVDLFFVLSGYLIGGQVLGQLKRGDFSVRRFYLRRALRILPCYWAVLAAYLLFPGVLEEGRLPPLWKVLSFTQNFGLDRSQAGVFSHAWSLCVEEHFYLLFPWIALLLARLPSARRAAALAALLVLGGMATRYAAWWSAVRPVIHGPGGWGTAYVEAIYYPTYQRLDGLIVGAWLAAVAAYRPERWRRLLARRAWLHAGALAGAGAVVWAELGKPGPVSAVLGYPLIALGLGCLLVAASDPRSRLGGGSVPGARACASISYCFYLIHKQVIHRVLLLGERHGLARESPWLLAGAFALSCAVAAILHFGLERPFLSLRERWGREPRFAPSGAVATR